MDQFSWKSASNTSTNEISKPYGMKCISCAISYFVFKAFAKFLTFCQCMRSSESAESTLIPLDTSRSSARAMLDLSCSRATAYHFSPAYSPQTEHSWHSRAVKQFIPATKLTCHLDDDRYLYSVFPHVLAWLLWQSLQHTPSMLMLKEKKKKTVQQSGVQKYNMKAKYLQLSPIPLFCTLIYEGAQGRPQWRSGIETCTDKIKSL